MVDLDRLDEPVWDLPTAAEVRRRGERDARRRRRAALGAVTGAVAVAALAVPLTRGEPTPDPPPVAVDPPFPPAATGPALTSGMSRASAETDADPASVRAATSCGRGRWVEAPTAAATEVQVATGPGEQRLLVVFDGVEAARTAYLQARDASRTCGPGGGRELAIVDVDGADQVWGLVVEGRESVVVARVGAVLLLDHATDDRRLDDRLDPILAAIG